MNDYLISNKILLRTPLLPIETIFDVDISDKLLHRIFSLNIIQEAIYISSRALHSELIKWLSHSIKDERDKMKMSRTLLKYLVRMSTRSTPFGLFAGCSILEVASKTEITSVQMTNHIKHIRFDMDVLFALSYHLSQNEVVKSVIKYFTNSSLYSIGGRYRYVEYRYIKYLRSYHLVEFDKIDYIEDILNKSINGATINELVYILNGHGNSVEDAILFINEMISSQLLISELEPNITGADPWELLIFKLKKYPELRELVNQLDEINLAFSTLKINNLGETIDKYSDLIKKFEELNFSYNARSLFQVDLTKPLQENSISETLLDEISDGVEVLCKLYSNKPRRSLSEFRIKFIEKFDQQAICILDILDSEIGIGYNASLEKASINILVDDIKFDQPLSYNDIAISPQERVLLSKYFTALEQDLYEIELLDDDLKELTYDSRSLPDSFALFATVIKNETTNVNQILFGSCGGSSANYALARFCHTNSEIRNLVLDIAEKENKLYDETLIAEIVHLPATRTGNILVRPVLHGFEIQYLGNSGADRSKIIPLSDIFVTVENNEIVLFSKSLNKRIIPRLSTAHSYYNNSLPLYQFLCDLQSQNVMYALTFTWGQLAQGFKFLPRLNYKNIILSTAKWHLKIDEYDWFLKSKKIEIDEVDNWRSKYKIPEKVVLLESPDAELYIDFKNLLMIQLFIERIKSHEDIILSEFLESPRKTVVKDISKMSFTHELIIPLYRITKRPTVKNRENIFNENIKRTFIPGEDWYYLKIYCGVEIADMVLGKFSKIIQLLLIEKKIIQWFFVRYNDSAFHLRFRVQVTDLKYLANIMEIFKAELEPMVEQRLVWKVQLDTYNRELERYGQDMNTLFEKLFWYDSISYIQFMKLIIEEDEAIRIKFAALSIFKYFEDFSFTFIDQFETLKSLSNAYLDEYNASHKLKIQLDKKYRIYKSLIYEIINFDIKNNELIGIINERSDKNIDVINKIKVLNNSAEFKSDDSVVKSIIHMSMNRIFKSKSRLNELVLYYMCFKAVNSKLYPRNRKIF